MGHSSEAFIGIDTAKLIFALSGRLLGGRVLSRNRPSTPASAKRRCQRQTVGLAIPASRATALPPE